VHQLTRRRYRKVPEDQRRGIAVALALDMVGSATGVNPETETVEHISQLLHAAWQVHHDLKRSCLCK